MHPFTFVSLAGVTMTIFLVVRICVQPSENRTAAIAFSSFLLCCAVFVFDDAYMRERWFERWPWFYGLVLPFVGSIGPFFFIYAQSTTREAFRWRWRHLLHFLVPILFLVLTILVLFAPSVEKIRLANEDFTELTQGTRSAGNLAVLAFSDAYMLAYLGAAWWQLWCWRERVEEEQEEGRTHPVRGIGLFATVVLLIATISAVFDFTPWPNTGAAITALATVMTLFALLWLATQPHPFLARQRNGFTPPLAESSRSTPPQSEMAAPVGGIARRPASEAMVVVAEPAPPSLAIELHETTASHHKPAVPVTAVASEPAEATDTVVSEPAAAAAEASPKSTGLKPEEVERIARRVRRLLETDRVFLEPELSLHVLAERAKTTRHKLSAVLKQAFGATFHQLISGYRVREAARQLESKEAAVRTIAEIAFASGFNTLSAFNAAFRAHLRETPSEYRDRVQRK